jgi:DNA replication protein DnaC
MNLTELDRALRTIRLSGMASTLETRVLQAQTDRLPPTDFLATLVSDELECRRDRLLSRRIKMAAFRDTAKTLDAFDFDFNRKMNRKLVFELATGHFVNRRENVVLLGPPGTGKSHIAQALGMAAILQGHRVLYREAHLLFETLTDATLDQRRPKFLKDLQAVPLLIIDDLGMKKVPTSAAEDLLEIVMRRHERASTIITSNREMTDWGKMLGDSTALTALLDRLLHHAHVLKCGPRSWRMTNNLTTRNRPRSK